ncbi:MAG TPA: GGDEF domain-containing protein [Pseudomonas sp.]|nr:GGDEF domain-containing protein [Pseudomonas sp.]
MFERLKNDFQLSIISAMGLFAMLAISPYAIYRMLQGNWLVGIVDTIMVTCSLLAVAVAWRTGDTVKPGIGIAIIVSIGVVLVALNLGVNGLFWVYVVILFNFFTVTPIKAMLLILLVLTALATHALLLPGQVFASDYQMLSFLVTSLTASGFVFIFATRMRNQRDQLQLLATLDPLTGAGNRRSMDNELRTAIAARRRHRTGYAALIMDLDHFKRVNDQFGHPAGDRVLMDFVQLIKTVSRQEDRLFRLGGEEFLLLLPNTDTAGLQAIAQKVQESVANQLRSPGEVVTVSQGGAVLRHDETVENWLKRADECLYQAKSSGRNRAVIDTQDKAALDSQALRVEGGIR